jgi:cytochrome bd-type quinol oxidase subunit 1
MTMDKMKTRSYLFIIVILYTFSQAIALPILVIYQWMQSMCLQVIEN